MRQRFKNHLTSHSLSDAASEDEEFVEATDFPQGCSLSGPFLCQCVEYALLALSGVRYKSPSLSSESSSDSFHSTMDTLLEAAQLLSHNQLYQTGLEQVSRGLVQARTMRCSHSPLSLLPTPSSLLPSLLSTSLSAGLPSRTAELLCSNDVDFLAKLYCVRLAFDELVTVPTNRNYFQQMGKELMADFLVSTGNVREPLASVDWTK